MIDVAARPRRSPDLHLVSDTDGELLVDAGGQPVVRLNETAAALWELCDGDTQVVEIAVAVRDLVGQDDVTGEVVRALEDLVLVRAVHVTDAPSTTGP